MERELAQIETVQTGLWLAYEAPGGEDAYAQPDILILRPDRLVVVEVKLTQTPAALPQLQFYAHLLRMARYVDTPVETCQVFHSCGAGQAEPEYGFDFCSSSEPEDERHTEVFWRI